MSEARFGLHATENTGLFQVKIPVPYPLKWVNAYLLRGDDGFTVIDPGIHTEDAIRVWDQVWKELGADYRHVERIVLTHHHPDHYGLAGWFQERSGGAAVLLSEGAYRQAAEQWGESRTMTEKLHRMFLENGLPVEAGEEMVQHLESFLPLVSPHPVPTFLGAGQRVRLGNDWYEAVETAGHASSHLSFYREENGEMLCGDHVLPRISPNICYLPGGDEHPLASYLRTLEEIARREVNWAYPGHREPFQGFRNRCMELIAHHERRLEQMRNTVAEAGETGLTAYEVSMRQFGSKLSTHQLRFAISETIAHLIHLEENGQVVRLSMPGIIRYAVRQ